MDRRIGSVSLLNTAERQTPNNDFGRMMARGLVAGSSAAAGAASAMLPGGAIISAAISQTAGRSGAGAMGGAVPAPSTGSGNVPATGAGQGALPDGLQGQRELMEQNQQWTTQYMALQNQMQQESREFTAVSNVLKVRHESSKTAINNIR